MQFRESDRAATHTPTVVQESLPAGAYLSARLWTSSPGGERATLPWDSSDPAVALAMDLLTASEGVRADTGSGHPVVTFRSFQKAILAARRLQWAMQGYSESDGLPGLSAAILIHSAEDTPDPAAGGRMAEALQKAAPGQILLTQPASQPIENLPGYQLKNASKHGLRELLWRSPESQTTRSFDEPLLAQLIGDRDVEGYSGAQENPAPAPAYADAGQQVKAPTGEFAQGHQGSPAASGSKRLVWIVGGVCAAALAIGGVVMLTRSPAKPEAAPIQPAQTAGTAAPGPAGPAHSSASQQSVKQNRTTPPAAGNQAPAAQPVAQRVEERAVVAPPQPAVVAPKPPEPQAQPRGRCDLDQSQIPGAIDQAEKSLARGKYADAQRQFGTVLACEPGNGRAREGLERVRRAREAESN